MELKFNQDGTQIFLYPEHKILHMKWSGINESTLFLDMLIVLRRLTLDHDIKGWLFDVSKAQTMPDLPLETYLEYLKDAFKKDSLRKYARVISQDKSYERFILTKLNLMKVAFGLNVEVANFQTEDEAMNWLIGGALES